MIDPKAEYQRRLKRHEREVAHGRRLDVAYSVARLIIFLVAVVSGVLAFSQAAIPLWVVLPPMLVFLALLGFHARSRRALEQSRRRETYYQTSLARLQDDWAGRGEQGKYAPDDHLYAEDLDLFGRGSLFEMICAAGTAVGRQRLAEWLTSGAGSSVMRSRQEAVQELSLRLNLREDLALRGLELDATLAPEALRQWAQSPAPLANRLLRVGAACLSFMTALAIAGFYFAGTGLAPFTLLILAQLILMWRVRDQVSAVVRASSDAATELRVLSRLLERLETESFENEMLRRLKREIEVEGLPPSRQVAILVRRVDMLDQLTHNQLLMIVGLVFLGVPQTAMAIEAWRARVGPSINAWLSAVADFEALASLGRFAFENPDYAFPEIVEGEALFESEGMAHPMLPAALRVSNDVELGIERRLLLVSGSNMSGKSTLLRTVGVNAVLALSGAPVCARGMRISPLRLGASIRVQDSLLRGNSRFYAEISKIRGIVGEAGWEPPLLFLMDEIFGGTNSNDRQVGASAVIRTLVKRGAIGLVTTHDLALSAIADEPALKAVNVHFEDDFRDGKIYFDYHLKPGLLERGNALALMRSIGLEV